MAKISVSVTAKTTKAKDNSRTIGYINPEATTEQIKQMAIAYNALSTKTYQSGEKIVRTDLNETTQTKTILVTNYNADTKKLTVSSNSTAPIRVLSTSSETSPANYREIIISNNEYTIPNDAINILIGQIENSNFTSAFKTITP